jgi:hypothetical protein
MPPKTAPKTTKTLKNKPAPRTNQEIIDNLHKGKASHNLKEEIAADEEKKEREKREQIERENREKEKEIEKEKIERETEKKNKELEEIQRIQGEIKKKIEEIKTSDYNSFDKKSIEDLISLLPSDFDGKKDIETEILKMTKDQENLIELENVINKTKFEKLPTLKDEINEIKYFNKENLIKKIQKITDSNREFNDKLQKYKENFEEIEDIIDSNEYKYKNVIDDLEKIKKYLSDVPDTNILSDLKTSKNILLSVIGKKIEEIQKEYNDVKETIDEMLIIGYQTFFKDSPFIYFFLNEKEIVENKKLVMMIENKELKKEYLKKTLKNKSYKDLINLRDYAATFRDELKPFLIRYIQVNKLDDSDINEIIKNFMDKINTTSIDEVLNERDLTLEKLITAKNNIYNNTLNGTLCKSGDKQKCIKTLNDILNSENFYIIKIDDKLDDKKINEAKTSMEAKIQAKINELQFEIDIDKKERERQIQIEKEIEEAERQRQKEAEEREAKEKEEAEERERQIEKEREAKLTQEREIEEAKLREEAEELAGREREREREKEEAKKLTEKELLEQQKTVDKETITKEQQKTVDKETITKEQDKKPTNSNTIKKLQKKIVKMKSHIVVFDDINKVSSSLLKCFSEYDLNEIRNKTDPIKQMILLKKIIHSRDISIPQIFKKLNVKSIGMGSMDKFTGQGKENAFQIDPTGNVTKISYNENAEGTIYSSITQQ